MFQSSPRSPLFFTLMRLHKFYALTHCVFVSYTCYRAYNFKTVLCCCITREKSNFLLYYSLVAYLVTDFVQDRLKMLSSPIMLIWRKNVMKVVTPPIEGELSISIRTFLNDYDAINRKAIRKHSIGTYSTIRKGDEKTWKLYCGDYLKFFASTNVSRFFVPPVKANAIKLFMTKDKFKF